VGSNLSRYYLNDLPAGIPSPGPLNPIYESLTAAQPLYSGGALDARLRQAAARLDALRETQEQARERLLLAAVTAYLDVVRDRAVVTLNQTSLDTLQRAACDAQKRFEVGVATRTDVAQAQARVAGARASLERAQAAERVS
jgi:outer membrane protein